MNGGNNMSYYSCPYASHKALNFRAIQNKNASNLEGHNLLLVTATGRDLLLCNSVCD
jgi:hypothetical protein